MGPHWSANHSKEVNGAGQLGRPRKMFVREVYINATECCMYGDSGIYETNIDDIGKLFERSQKEFGRCIGKVYVDQEETTMAVGWVFQKKQLYGDVAENYLQETWVTLYERPDTVMHHYKKVA